MEKKGATIKEVRDFIRQNAEKVTAVHIYIGNGKGEKCIYADNVKRQRSLRSSQLPPCHDK